MDENLVREGGALPLANDASLNGAQVILGISTRAGLLASTRARLLDKLMEAGLVSIDGGVIRQTAAVAA